MDHYSSLKTIVFDEGNNEVITFDDNLNMHKGDYIHYIENGEVVRAKVTKVTFVFDTKPPIEIEVYTHKIYKED